MAWGTSFVYSESDYKKNSFCVTEPIEYRKLPKRLLFLLLLFYPLPPLEGSVNTVCDQAWLPALCINIQTLSNLTTVELGVSLFNRDVIMTPRAGFVGAGPHPVLL